MTEGVSTSSAPSNGSTAPTTPAPGTTSATPTPKNGEGAVAPSPAKGASSVTEAPKWQPIKTKLRLGDKEEEVEIPDEETLQRRLIAAKSVDRYSKDLNRERAERKAEQERLKAMGFDPANPDAWFQKRLEEEARRHGMTEEQRAIDDANRKAQQLEAQLKAERIERQRLLNEQMDARAWGELEPRLQKAMQSHQMIADTHAMETIEAVAKEFLEAGLDVPPEQVVAEAAAREKERFIARLTTLPAKELRHRLTPEQFNGLAAIYLEEWKAKRAPGAKPDATPAPKPAEPSPTEGFLDYHEAKRKGIF